MAGAMAHRRYCQRCLYTTDHPLGLVVDDSGICSGCRVHEEKDLLDWNARWEQLRETVREYRSLTGASYDCIVPVTGGGDSFFIMHMVKDRLGLNPLAVTYNTQFNSALGIRNLARLRQVFDVTLRQKTIRPATVRRIVKATLIQFGSVYWHAIAGQTVFPVQTSVETRIPLIIWGAHQGLEQVGMFSHLDNVEMSRRYRKEHDLLGREAEDLLISFNELSEGDIWQFRYPEDEDLLSVGVRGIYLGNFVRWDPLAQNHQMAMTHGYRAAHVPGTFDPYEHLDSLVYMGFHDYLKAMKHGYRKVTDQAVREIRHGRLARSEANALVGRTSDRTEIPWLRSLAEWLGATERGLILAADEHRSKSVWQRAGLSWERAVEDSGQGHVGRARDCDWELGVGVSLLNPPPETAEGLTDQKFTLFGRGFPN
jgi:N-acetyl sugar amidotransferase